MKHLIVSVLSLLMVVSLAAQQDQKAKTILDAMRDKTKSYQVISADFIFSIKNSAMDIDEENQGVIKLKGQKYVLELPEIGIKIFSDGKTVWNYMRDGNQVTVSDIDDSGSELMDPASLFSIYERGYRSKFSGETTLGASTCYQVELYPDTDETDVTKVLLNIGKSDYMLKSAQLFSTDGNLYAIEVKSINTTGNLPDNYFIFNPANYPDIEVIDFR